MEISKTGPKIYHTSNKWFVLVDRHVRARHHFQNGTNRGKVCVCVCVFSCESKFRRAFWPQSSACMCVSVCMSRSKPSVYDKLLFTKLKSKWNEKRVNWNGRHRDTESRPYNSHISFLVSSISKYDTRQKSNTELNDRYDKCWDLCTTGILFISFLTLVFLAFYTHNGCLTVAFLLLTHSLSISLSLSRFANYAKPAAQNRFLKMWFI